MIAALAGWACNCCCLFAQTQTLYMSVLSSRAHQWGRNDNPMIGLFVSSDRGATWEHRGWREYIRTFHSVEGNDGTLWSACGNGVLRSTDGGKLWKVTTGWEVTEVLRIAVDPEVPKHVYAATAYGLIATTDGGETWDFRRNGLKHHFTTDVCVDRKKRSHLLIATEAGVHSSDDAGLHWRPTALIQKNITTIVQDPAAETMFWAGTEDDGLWRSTDGGNTWSPAHHGFQHRTIYSIVVDDKNPRLMFAGTQGGGVYRSTDRGELWQQCANGLTNLNVHSLAIVHGSPVMLLAGTLNDGLFQSTDSGSTWTFNSQSDAQIWGLSLGEGRRLWK